MELYKKAMVICTILGLSIWNVTEAYGGAEVEKGSFGFDVDTCSETVWVEGWFLGVLLELEDENGGFHYISQLTAHGTGVGQSSGINYVWNDSFEHLVENYTPGEAREGNWITRTKLISKGPADDPSFWLTAHYTITPDGDVIVDRFDPVDNCLDSGP